MTNPKYNPNKNGKATFQKPAPLDPVTRLYFRLGNGCSDHQNCFTCPFPDCIWMNNNLTRRQTNVSMG